MNLLKITTCALCAGALILNVHQHNEIVDLHQTIHELNADKAELQEDLFNSNITISYYEYELKSNSVPLYDIGLSDELQQYTYDMCKKYDIVDKYDQVLAVMWQESNYIPDIISATDDYGLMQINKCNHEYLNEVLGVEDFLDPYSNIECGVYLLSGLYEDYIDDHMVLMAYNMGRGGAASKWEQGIYSSSYSRAVLDKVKNIRDI